MADDVNSGQIQVVEPGFFDDYHDEIAQQDGAVISQQQMLARLAELQSKANLHDRALAMLLLRGEIVSVDVYVVIGETGNMEGTGYKNLNLPDYVTQQGDWVVDSIAAFGDGGNVANISAQIREFPPGISWFMSIGNLAQQPINMVGRYRRRLRATEFDKIEVRAQGTAGDKAALTFNLERIR